MSYSFKGRVRYSEIGEDGCLTLPGIQNYYQDCCTFQSENIGQGMKALEERQRAWVLSSWQIVVNRYPGLGETIVASTAPYGFKGFGRELLAPELADEVALAEIGRNGRPGSQPGPRPE